MKNIKLDLKSLRTKHGLYQYELAKIIGASSNAMSYIERGVYSLTDKQYIKLVKHFSREEVEKFAISEKASLPTIEEDCTINRHDCNEVREEEKNEPISAEEQVTCNSLSTQQKRTFTIVRKHGLLIEALQMEVKARDKEIAALREEVSEMNKRLSEVYISFAQNQMDEYQQKCEKKARAFRLFWRK